MLEIEFIYPPPHPGEFYDPEKMMAYIFGSRLTIEDCLRNINHANLHYIIQKLEGKKTSFKFDKISRKVLKRDKELYEILY